MEKSVFFPPCTPHPICALTTIQILSHRCEPGPDVCPHSSALQSGFIKHSKQQPCLTEPLFSVKEVKQTHSLPSL